MRVLIATTGALSPGPAVEFAQHLIGPEGSVTVMTVIEVPRSFLDDLRSESWHPLVDGASISPFTSESDAVIERYVEERGRRLAEPILASLRAEGIEADALYVEGEDPAMTISLTATKLDVDVVVLGATRRIFAESSWKSVSARVMAECAKPVLVVPHPPKDLTPDDDSPD